MMEEVELNINGIPPKIEHRSPLRYSSKATLAQFLATMANSLTGFSIGMMLAIPSVVIGALSNREFAHVQFNTTNHDDTLILSDEEGSWYGSFLYIVQPIGCLLGGLLQNYIGRKYGMMLMNIPELVAWFLLYTATSVNMLHASSLLMGVSIGFIEAPGVAYICEITEPHFRGIFTLFGSFTVTSGVVVEYFLSSFYDWRTTSFLSMTVPMITLPILSLIPDSPMWLLSKNKKERAAKALCWLRGWVTRDEVETEFQQLCQYAANAHKLLDDPKGERGAHTFLMNFYTYYLMRIFNRANINAIVPAGKPKSNNGIFKSLLESSTMKPLRLLVIYGFFSHCAFAAGTKNDSINIFKYLQIPMQAEKLAFITTIIGIFGNVLCIVMLKYTGKRKTSLISMVLSCVTTVLIGLYVYYRTEINSDGLCILLFCLSSLFMSLGIISIPWIMMGEIFPLKTRAVGVGITGAVYYMYMFLLNKTYIYSVYAVGIHGCFLIYGLVGFIGFFYMYYYLPETEGKSLVQIEEIFSSKKMRAEHYKKL